MSQCEPSRQPVNDALVAEIRGLIARRRLSVTELATTSGIPRSSLHNKLSLRSALTVSELTQLAVALDVPLADLLERAAAGADITGHP